MKGKEVSVVVVVVVVVISANCAGCGVCKSFFAKLFLSKIYFLVNYNSFTEPQ